MLPVKKEFPYNKIGSYTEGNPYTIAFVYPKEGQPFIVKGGSRDIDKYLSKTVAVAHLTYWKRGVHRSSTYFYGVTAHYVRYCKKEKISLVLLTHDSRIVVKRIRRIPRKWPVELNQYT